MEPGVAIALIASVAIPLLTELRVRRRQSRLVSTNHDEMSRLRDELARCEERCTARIQEMERYYQHRMDDLLIRLALKSSST